MPVLPGSSRKEREALKAYKAEQAERKAQEEQAAVEAAQKAAAAVEEERQKQHEENMRKEKIRVEQEAIELAAMNLWLEKERKAKKAYHKRMEAEVEAEVKGLENGTHRLENFAAHTFVVEKGIRPRSVDLF